MALIDLFAMAALFAALGFIQHTPTRKRLLLFLSILFLFRLQPALPIRFFDFWFPFLTIALTLCVWRLSGGTAERAHQPELCIILGTVLIVAATRFFDLDGYLTRTRPPQLRTVALILSACILLLWLAGLLTQKNSRFAPSTGVYLILGILILLKVPALALRVSMALRSLVGQSPQNAAASDLRWLGFSYIAFRLLSVVLDARQKRPVPAAPGDFLTYVIFPPTLSAGPIDRPEHFLTALNAPRADLSADLMTGAERIAAGLFKKFVLADSLAKMALSPSNAGQLHDGIWAWAALCFYGLQLYFDFAGYSDIAIGIAQLIGIKLPENFRRPYLKPDIAKFWNNWHITLTQWIRTYVFNPLTRQLRMRKNPSVPQWLVVLITQMVTMLLIGLWHGGTVNFALWGVWHGIGLFVHQQYERRTKGWLFELSERAPLMHRFYTIGSTMLTIAYVMIGWVWFALPDFSAAIHFFEKLF